MTALTVGLIAYQSQHTTVTVLGLNEATAQLAGLAMLAVSAVAGLSRMEAKVTLLQLNAEVLNEHEKAGAMRQAFQISTPIIHNTASGELHSRAQLTGQIKTALSNASEAQAQCDQLKRKPFVAYKLRNFLFLAGTAALAVAKLLPAQTPR
jgi:hypothetical protein